MKIQFQFLLYILFTFAACNIVAQNARYYAPKEYVISHWNLDDGLPQSTVNAVVQTQDGYIWLATWGGLVRFDGVKFTVFDRSNSPDMLSDRATNLFEDRNGGLWICTEQYLALYKDDVFKTITAKDGINNQTVIRVREDKNGAIWAFTPTNVYKLTDNHFVLQNIIHDDSLQSRALNGFGDFWFVNNKSLVRLIDGRLIYCINTTDFTDASIWDVIEDSNGTLWIATNGDGLFTYKKNLIKHFKENDGLFSNKLRKLLIDHNNDIWAVGLGGISRISNNRIYSITKDDGLSDSDIDDIMQDREGNYWVGTITGGLNKLRKSVITVYGEKQGLNEEKLLSLCFRKNGALLIGTNCDGIYELKNNPSNNDESGKIYYSGLNKFLTNTCVWAIYEDSKQRIWIGTRNLIVADNNKVRSYSTNNGFTGTFIWAIYEDKSGTMWIGCSNGLFSFSKGIFHQYTTKDGLPANEIHSIFQDKNSNLWVGTVNGLCRISNNNIQSFPSIEKLKSNYIRAIYQDNDGILWFGSYGGGLIRLKDNKFTVITMEDGLFDNIVSHIVEDDSGYFWMGCNRGISRVNRNELNNFADGKIKSVYVTSYGKQDGMTTVETNGGFQPNAVKDNNGKIYFPTVQGLVVVDPKKIIINKKMPDVHIEKFIVSGKDKINFTDNGTLNKILQIPYDSSDIQIEYTGLSFVDPKKVQFRYIIEGYDEKWIDAGNRRTAYYIKVPPGSYNFKVTASNNDGIWNDKNASYQFTVLPPFWMTWWFRGIIIMIFITIGPFIYFIRISKFKKEHERQHLFSRQLIESQENERKRIAFELHDSLGQNLLLVKNKLLMGIKELKEGQPPDTYFADASDAVSNSIQEIREISQNLRPHHLDQLGLSLAIESIVDKIADSSDIEIDFKSDLIDGFIQKDNEINFFRIVQECLNNIVKHSKATKASIVIEIKESKIHLLIEDNGIGIATEFLDGRQGSLGVIGMRERTKILNGEIYFHTALNAGTKIELIIPISV